MDIEFDPAKDATNIAKHGLSLARAVDLEILVFLQDDRFTVEVRYRAYGLIDGAAHCLAFTVRANRVRAISLRRAHAEEMKLYIP